VGRRGSLESDGGWSVKVGGVLLKGRGMAFRQRSRVRKVGSVSPGPGSDRAVNISCQLVDASGEAPEHLVMIFRPEGMQKRGVLRLSLDEVYRRCAAPRETEGLHVTMTVRDTRQEEFSWIADVIIPMRPVPGSFPQVAADSNSFGK
jgi:hypothetical protein